MIDLFSAAKPSYLQFPICTDGSPFTNGLYTNVHQEKTKNFCSSQNDKNLDDALRGNNLAAVRTPDYH
jgi:hypothetical protein